MKDKIEQKLMYYSAMISVSKATHSKFDMWGYAFKHDCILLFKRIFKL